MRNTLLNVYERAASNLQVDCVGRNQMWQAIEWHFSTYVQENAYYMKKE